MRDSWTETTLGEAARINPREAALAESAPFIPMDAVHVGKRFPQYYQPRGTRNGTRAASGDILFARITPCLENGKVAQVPLDVMRCGGSTEFIVIRGSDIANANFLYFWATWVETRVRAAGLMTGTTGRQRISASDLAGLALLLPPLSAQKRIVHLIASIDAYIAALELQAAVAQTARNAVLHELLNACGDDWTEATLGELCDLYQPETISRSHMDEGAPYVVYGANGPIGRYHSYNHAESEVAITCRGATCGVVNLTPVNCWITGNAMVVQPRDSRILKQFLYWALKTSVDVKAAISGSAQPQITRTGLSPSKIKFPARAQQQKIVGIISSIEALIRSNDEVLAEAKQLRSGLLSELLSGDHEIPESYDRLLGAA